MTRVCVDMIIVCVGAGSVDWRQKLDAQRAAVVAAEIKNNGFKLARWTAQAVMAGCDELAIGYDTIRYDTMRCVRQTSGR